jgi:P pilus assembly chaperone PapD
MLFLMDIVIDFYGKCLWLTLVRGRTYILKVAWSWDENWAKIKARNDTRTHMSLTSCRMRFLQVEKANHATSPGVRRLHLVNHSSQLPLHNQ